MLNPLFLNQLISKMPDLHEEILQILKANTEPMTCLEIFDKSEVAVTSRDIRLEMKRKLEAHGMVEIDRKVRRPGTGSDVAYWKIIQVGVDYLNERQSSDVRDESNFRTSLTAIPDSDFEVEKPQQPAVIESEKAMTQKTGSALQKVTLKEIVNFVILKGRIKKSAIYDQFAWSSKGNLERLQKDVYYLISQDVLKKFKGDSHLDDEISLGSKANEFLAKERNKTNGKKEPKQKVPPYKIIPYDQVNPSVKGRLESLHRAEVNKPDSEISQYVEIDADELSKNTLNNVFDTDKPVLKETSVQPDAAKQSFRVAYTSDGCLIIMGLHMPIELDAAQTRELINYVDDMKLSEVA